jgi:hypothetical protein
MSGGYAPGTMRIWDGTAWRLAATEWAETPYQFIAKGGASGLISTTTTCTKTATSVHKGSALTLTASTTGRNGGSIEFYYGSPGSGVKFATVAAPAGGGNVTTTHAPSANTTYYAKFTGSSTHAPSSSAATSTVTVQTYKTTTSNFYVGWTQAYNGAGSRISGTGHDGAVHQGFYSSTHGNRKSLLYFNPTFPAGAVVSKVIFDCNAGWAYWYDKAGGVAVVGYFTGQNTEPSSWNTVNTVENRTRKDLAYSSYWEVDITSWAASVVTSSSFSGITLGPGPSTNPGYFGYSVDSPAGNFILRVTYSYWS